MTKTLNHKKIAQDILSEYGELETKKIVKEIGDRKVDVIIAGPPCQGFSLTGPRNENDKRNKLF